VGSGDGGGVASAVSPAVVGSCGGGASAAAKEDSAWAGDGEKGSGVKCHGGGSGLYATHLDDGSSDGSADSPTIGEGGGGMYYM